MRVIKENSNLYKKIGGICFVHRIFWMIEEGEFVMISKSYRIIIYVTSYMLSNCHSGHFRNETKCTFLKVVCRMVECLTIAKYKLQGRLILFKSFMRTFDLLLKPVTRNANISGKITMAQKKIWKKHVKFWQHIELHLLQKKNEN